MTRPTRFLLPVGLAFTLGVITACAAAWLLQSGAYGTREGRNNNQNDKGAAAARVVGGPGEQPRPPAWTPQDVLLGKESPRPAADVRRAFLEPESSSEAGRAWRAFGADLALPQLQGLLDDPSPSIGLAASWEIRSRLPKQYVLLHAQRFLGFAEGRTQARIPLRWEVGLLGELTEDPESYQKMLRPYAGRAPFLVSTGREVFVQQERLREYTNELAPLHTPTDTLVTRSDRKITVKVGEKSVSFSESLIGRLSSDPFSGQTLRAVVDDRRAFVVLYDWDGEPFPVVCVDSRTGELIWKAVSWGYGGDNLPFRSGSWSQDVELVVTGERLGLFGSGPRSHYLETFDAKTGAVLARFSSNTWYCSP